MTTYIRELYDARDLLSIWVQREIKARYTTSTLGFAWAVLQPLAVLAIFSFVFSVLLSVPTRGVPYPLWLFCGLSSWLFFNSSITSSTNALIGNMNLVKKVYFPREIFPIGALMVNVVDFMIATAIFVIMLIIDPTPFYPTLLLYPLILAIQLCFMMGLSLFLSSFIVFFCAVRFIVPLVLQMWMYLTPVFYPLEQVPPNLLPFYMLNPMAAILDSYRRVALFGQLPDWGQLAYAAVVSVLLLVAAYLYFKRSERELVDQF